MDDSVKAVFLDRDGVINEFPGYGKYVTGPKEFHFLPGSIEAVRKLKENDFKLFIVSNQQGVAKGLYSLKDLKAIDRKMLSGFKKKKTSVDGIFYCTHLAEEDCACRKPKTGLLTQALSGSVLRRSSSFFVGDSMIDMQTAQAMEIKSVLVLSGREKIAERNGWSFNPDFIFDNLLLAAHYICAHAK